MTSFGAQAAQTILGEKVSFLFRKFGDRCHPDKIGSEALARGPPSPHESMLSYRIHDLIYINNVCEIMYSSEACRAVQPATF